MTDHIPAADDPVHSNPGARPSGPLAGVRVLDVTSVVMGPYATQILGDLGADVISIESARGDTNRAMGPGPLPQLSGVALNLLRNKRNVSLDFKHPEGHRAVLAIAATCDVFVTNLRPGTLARAGLAYEQVSAIRPDVVYCQAHGYATGGARQDDPAYDDVIQAETGIADAMARVTGQPMITATLMADKVRADDRLRRTGRLVPAGHHGPGRPHRSTDGGRHDGFCVGRARGFGRAATAPRARRIPSDPDTPSTAVGHEGRLDDGPAVFQGALRQHLHG
jgi:hypothetical protein